ncbi:myotubularin-related protein 13 [Phlebotomus papatasi]|nr:myotubularin-related protein 13 [Phlebotomus papatasi]
MSRLADYFVIVGYDHEKERSGTRSGKILQRFPENDWHDTPFIEGIEWFCQPLGWALSTERQEPRFFVSVLTDIDANRHYCACLCFNETISITPNKPIDEEEETLTPGRTNSLIPAVTTVTHHSIMYAPKCLVLVSRLDYTETFRNCLGTIYTVYIESLGFPLETLIGNILGCIQVPPPGGPQVRFSIGAGDKQALQPPLYSTLPVTGTSVDFLFTQLGIKNVLLLFCAMMTEHKILFHSKSYSRLTDSCRALTALMYPFRYSHVYIPILPASLIEVLSTPTPFIMGVHSSLQSEITDLLDVIIADIDGGSIHIPESLVPPVSKLPNQLWETTQLALTLVLQPELQTADLAFSIHHPVGLNGDLHCRDVKVNRMMRDKEIRAVFMRMFAQLLQGYRSCLTIIRIHPKPVITFHKAGFLGARDLIECDFLSRVLDSMFFTGFVTERGPPWRPCDAWDELYSSMSDLQRSEQQNVGHVLSNIQELAQVLYTNENPNPQTYTQKVLKPPEGAFARIHQPPMPQINSQQVTAIIQEGMAKNDLQSRFHTPRMSPRIVPMGPHLQSISDGRPVVNNTARRLEVLKSCVNCIFENKIAEARKSFPAVLRTLKQRDARLTLCRELAKTVQGNKAMLEHQQFDLVVKLMNRALQDDTAMDEHGVAAALLPLSTVFCRKLCTGVIQFSYTCIQDHPVWKNQQFWEAAFYQDVQTQIKALYLTRSSSGSDNVYATWKTENGKKSPSSSPEYRLSRIQEPSALEIAAEQMRIWPSYESPKQGELIKSEESTLYSQAIHYANRMVSLLIPPDVNIGGKVQKLDVHGVEDDTSVSNSVVESHSHSEHSDEGFEESDTGECGSAVAKMVCRFIDRVCTEGGVTADHLRNLHAMVPGVVHMHIEMLEAVYRESKRIPPVQKAKIHAPSLLSGEDIMTEPMRVYLLADGREDNVSGLLPAEGALFLTNYRVVFKGSPCDQLACEQSIVRAFPVSSLTKEKRISVLYLPHLDQNLPEGLQMRSCTFQLIKVAFDEEVTVESIESFRKLLHRVRHPEHEFGRFAFASHGMHIQTPLHKVKEKNATLKGFAKKTLMRTAKKAGFKPKGGTKRKYILSGIDSEENHGHDNNEDDDGSDDNADTMPRVTAKDVERLKERSYVKDWERLYLNDTMSGYRITTVNCNYSLCRTYPAILVSPHRISDDQLRCIARCYKNQRIPVPTWRHRNGAILLRGSVPHAKGVMGMLKAHQGSTNAATDSTAFQEQDTYFVTVIDNLPHTVTPMRHHQWEMSNSNLSINSLLLAAEDHHFGARTDNLSTLTPEIARKSTSNVFQTAKSSFGNFSGRAVKNVNKWGSLKSGPGQLRTPDGLDRESHHQYDFQRVPLYMLGEKSQSKSARLSEMYAEFIPVDYPDVRHTRLAFKKLMRACLPSSTTQEPDQSFAKLLEQSEWLQQIRGLLQLSGAVVDLIDMQGSSVTLALEDGWDVTAQVSALAQLCLDPYYRTVEGFRVLIEKEWLAFGHRFGHRSNLRPHSSSGSPFAPTFLQFLDAVHQIQTQFPLAFEFNDFFLRFLAYHSVSCRFRTFLFDCELERFDLGIATVEDKRGSLNSHHKHAVETSTGSDDDSIYPGGLRNSSSSAQKLGHSVFDYIERQHAKSPIFFNFTYTPDPDRQVLRPQSSVAMLELWGFYVDEEIAHGPPYDPELVGSDNLDDENETAEGRKPKRKVISVGYDSLDKLDPDAFTRLLEELKMAEAERGLLPQKWRQVWDKLELPHSDSLTRHASFSSALVRSHGRLQHKRSTLEILMRGRLAGHHQETFSHPHRFEKHAYTTPSHCNHCDGLLWGPMRTELRCMDCGNSYHEKCAETVPKNCTKYKAVEGVQQTLTRSQGDNGSITSSATAGQTSLQHFYDQFSSNVAENRTHEGHLYKRGALLKSWKQRWFVLDSIKHQLRYYDAMEDSNCKGFIDLAEVQSVQPAPSAAVGTKKVDEKAFFDLKTSRRTYNFYALDANMAQEWIEKIQACLQ